MTKSDICRSAYLYHHGGYYLDLDVELNLPFAKLVENDTDFFSAWNAARVTRQGRTVGFRAQSGLLNAIIGTAPHSEVLRLQLRRMMSIGAAEVSQSQNSTFTDGSGIFGPETLLMALTDFMRSCGEQLPATKLPDFNACGTKVRMLEEADLEKPELTKTINPRVLARARRQRPDRRFDGRMFGLFYTGKPIDGVIVHVGFPRFDDCREYGCGSLVQSVLPQQIPPRR